MIFVVTFLNLLTYCATLLAFFSLFFILNSSHLKTLNELKAFSQINFFLNTNVLVFLSLAGLPPFLTFFNKFFLFFFIFNSFNFFYFFLFLLLNCFSIYFYIQNLRSLVTKQTTPSVYYKNNFISLNFSITFFLVFLSFFFIFGFLFLPDIFIFLSPLF